MRVLALLVLACSVGACNDSPVSRSLAPGSAAFGKAPSTPGATFQLPLPNSTLQFKGDGRFPDAANSYSAYTDGVCGVKATVHSPNPTQDAVMQTDNPTASDKKCVAYGPSVWPRTVTIDYGDGSESNPGTINVHDLGSVVGTQLRWLGMSLSSGRCDRLQFGGPYGGDSVWVTVTGTGSWHVYSQAAPRNTAVCVTSSGNTTATQTYAGMNVDFVVTVP